MQRIRTLVVDDEPLARRRVVRLLEEEENVELVGQCSNGQEAVAAIRQTEPDLVFLDVQMPEVDGFGVLEAIGPGQMPAVIFVTAFDQYAIRAFEVHALDYLLKPFDQERFQKAFRRARTYLERHSTTDYTQQLVSLLEHLRIEPKELERLAGRGGEHYLERLLVKARGRFFFLRTAEIEWIEAEGNYVRLHASKASYLIRETMSAMERKLDPGQFLRIHRSTIINLDQIKELRSWLAGDYIVTLKNGTEVKLSRSYRERLEERIGNPL